MFSRSFILFSISGTFGFIVDAGTFYIIDLILGNPYISRVFSYVFAASFTWIFNRKYSFNIKDDIQLGKKIIFEWFKYLSSQLAGFSLNYAVFSFMVFSFSLFSELPILAIAIGSIAGLFVNYFIAKKIVFKINEK